MKALVLGGNGFIGSHLVDSLLSAGHHVRIFDRSANPFRPCPDKVDERLAAFDDTPALAEALSGCDVVYHLISTTVPSTSNLDPVHDIQSNLINTVKLLQLMVQQGTKRLVYLSSGGTVYGNPLHVPIEESHPLRPLCSYGVVKVAIENYLRMYQELHGLCPVILRVSNPYGPRQGHAGVQGVIATLLNKALHGDTIDIWGDGSVVRDFIYVEDLAQVCLLAGTSGTDGTFNVGAGAGHSLNDIITSIEQLLDGPLAVRYLPGRSFDVARVVLDTAKVGHHLGWQANTDLPDGLATTFTWMQKNI